LNNVFQAKIRNEKGEYNKTNFLTWNSSISYDPLQDSLKLSEMTSNIRIKNFSGNELFRINMHHNFYSLGDDKKPIDKMVNIWGGELPRLTDIDIVTDMKLKLSGSAFGDMEESDDMDTAEDIDEEFYNEENQKKPQKRKGNNLWETRLNFRYRTDWSYPEEDWNYTFSLNTTHKINLSRNWSLSYTANFNLKEKEMIRNKFSIYRPLHCWEFSFSYWPQGISSGFSLKINVINPDLHDIKVISSDANRSFGSY
jgi:hypothetical protein